MIKHLVFFTFLKIIHGRTLNLNSNVTNNQILLGSHDGETDYKTLHILALTGQTNVARNYLKNCENEIDIETSFGNTPLHLAAEYGSKEIVELLLNSSKRTYEFVIKKNKQLRNALHLSALKGHHEISKLLIKDEEIHEYRDLIDSRDELGKIPLFYALRSLW